MSARTSADGDDRSSACSTRPGRPQSSASACGQDVPARVLRSAARRPRPGSRSPRHGSGSGCAADGATYLIVSTAPKAARTANHSVRSHAAGSTAGPATPRPGPSQPGRRALGGRGLLHAGPGGPVPQGQVDHALEVGGGRGTSRSPARETGSPRAVGRPTRSGVTTRPRAIQNGKATTGADCGCGTTCRRTPSSGPSTASGSRGPARRGIRATPVSGIHHTPAEPDPRGGVDE